MTATKTGKKHWTSYTVPGIWSLPEHQKISHAIRVGNTIHISGQTARGLNGEAEGGSDVEAQGLAIWRHIETILTSVGASMDDIVKVFQFVVGQGELRGDEPSTEGGARRCEAEGDHICGSSRFGQA